MLPGVFNIQNYGADPTGAADTVPALTATCLAAGPSGHVIAPPGQYVFMSSVDFSQIFPSMGLYKFRFECLGGVEFFQDASFTSGTLFNLTTTDTFQILNCQFLFNTITGRNSASNPVTAIRLRYFSDSVLEVDRINNFLGSSALWVDCSGTPTGGCFNNDIRVHGITGCKRGFVSSGSSGEFGFQGNTVHLDHVTNSATDQIVTDVNGTGLNSKNNSFYCGAVEHGSGAGIIDCNGQNYWVVNNSNSNANGGFYNSSPTSAPLVVGCFDDGVHVLGSALPPRVTTI